MPRLKHEITKHEEDINKVEAIKITTRKDKDLESRFFLDWNELELWKQRAHSNLVESETTSEHNNYNLE